MAEAPQPFQPAIHGAPWRPASVVLHETADGAHFDLLLACRDPAGPDDPACATWRAADDPAQMQVGAVTAAERIGDHRALYLQLAGPAELSGGRGRVHPVAHGAWRACTDGAVEVRWSGGGTARYLLDGQDRPAALLRRIAQ